MSPMPRLVASTSTLCTPNLQLENNTVSRFRSEYPVQEHVCMKLACEAACDSWRGITPELVGDAKPILTRTISSSSQ